MLYTSENIPYQEYRAIRELLGANSPQIERSLRAAIVFGEIVATGGSQDINLLEVVDGWQGPRFVSYGSTEALPLRGRLNLYFLTPEEFEQPSLKTVPGQAWSSAQLLSRIRPAYAVLREKPFEYAYTLMRRFDEMPIVELAMEAEPEKDPLSFLQHQMAV